MKRIVLTAAEIAERPDHPIAGVQVLLEESVSDGFLERAGCGFRLTAEAERRHGRHLRGLPHGTWRSAA